MTPISQHSYSVASVCYLGPAYTESQAVTQTPKPQPVQGDKAGGQHSGR